MAKTANLGEAIRLRRYQLGLTQEALAALIGGGMRQAEVSRLETGRVTLPRRERLERIATALGLTLGELLSRSGWTGAERAFPSDPPVSYPASALPPTDSPVGDPLTPPESPVPRAEPVGSIRLQRALAAAAATRARSVDTLARVQAAYDYATKSCAVGRKTAACDSSSSTGETSTSPTASPPD